MEPKNNVHLSGTINFADFKVGQSGTPYLRFSVKTKTAENRDAYIELLCFGDVASGNKGLAKGDEVDVIAELSRGKNNKTDMWETRVIARVVKQYDAVPTPNAPEDVGF